MKTLSFHFGLFLIIVSGSFAWTSPVAIKDAKIHTMAGPVIEKGTIVFDNGKILAVGSDVKPPADAKIIDGSGKIVMPGMIDANCHVGLEEISQVTASVDSSESTDPVTPQLYVMDGFFPESAAIPVTRRNGVTAGIISPDDINVFTGMSALVEFSGKRIDHIVLKGPIAMNVTLGEAPKTTFGPKNKMPMTRMGTAALLRKTLQEAREYGEKWKLYSEKGKEQKKNKERAAKKPPEKDLKLEALQNVLNGKIPLVAAAQESRKTW
jgi:imidazolonepropionase-like amidohydrolase